MKKFSKGDFVRVKSGVVVGQYYSNLDGTGDYFYAEMTRFRGFSGTVTRVVDNGYYLDVDGETWVYTDQMLVKAVDLLASRDVISQTDNQVVVLAVMKSQIDMLSKLIDEALDNGDEEAFLKHSEYYTGLSKDFEKLQLETENSMKKL